MVRITMGLLVVIVCGFMIYKSAKVKGFMTALLNVEMLLYLTVGLLILTAAIINFVND